MAIQSDVYEGSALTTRTFPSSKHISTKQHMAVWGRYTSNGTWTQFDTSEYQLINNSCVLDTVLNTSTYDRLEIRVADAPDELTTSLSDIAVVSSISSSVTTVSDSIDSVNRVSESIVNVNVASSNIDAIDNVATAIVPNIDEILLTNDNAAIAVAQASIATTKASEASDSATSASSSASASEAAKVLAEAAEAKVAPYYSDIDTVATNISNIGTVATNINNINAVGSTITIANKANYIAYGFTKALTVEDRFLESNEPNVVVDKVSEPVVFSDGLYERTANSQATLPVAPFAPTSTDELLDDKVNGLTCQMAHSKGDVVVTGNELVTNGTFDSDVSGWTGQTGGTISYNAGRIQLSGSTGRFSNNGGFLTESGVEYIATCDVEVTGDTAYLRVDSGANLNTNSIAINSRTNNGKIVITFIGNGNVVYVGGVVLGATTIYFDNISVKLKDNIYQATVDTADMYDYDDTSNVVMNTIGEVLYCTGNNSSGTVGNFYKKLSTSISEANTTNLTNTNNWQNLGTADNMSLQNPYFQTLPQVTRQDVITLRKHKTSKVVDYHTFKGTKYFGEGYSQADVMSYYGFSQVDKNLWEDATYEYVFVELKSSLNAGSYHPVYNAMGCRPFVDSSYTNGNSWYASDLDFTVNSTYTTFDKALETGLYNGSIGSTSTRSDSKFYDKVYLSGLGGLIPSSKYLAYAGKEMPRLLDSESNDLLSESWLEEGVDTYVNKEYNTTTTTQLSGTDTVVYINDSNVFNSRFMPTVANGTVLLSDIDINTLYSMNIIGKSRAYSVIAIGRSSTYGSYFKIEGNYVSDFEAPEISNMVIQWTVKQPHLLTYKSSTTTDIIGNPSNYPTDWLSHLASGKSIVGNALLVDDAGNSLIPDGSTRSIPLSKKNINQVDSAVTSVDSVSWAASSIDTDNFNTVSNSTKTFTNILGALWVLPYVSSNQAALQSDPQKVLQVQPKAIASNSHSIYKGAMMTYAGTGKVAVGNGTNSVESKGLDNATIGIPDLVSSAGNQTWYTNQVILFDKVPLPNKYEGAYIRRIGADSTTDWSTWGTETNIENTILAGVFVVDSFGGTPTHNTISLDNSNSPATKWFTTLAEMEDGELAIQTFSDEMVSNSGAYDGDNQEFNQLTNGTSTDLNNNTIQTKVLTKRLGIYKGDI